MARFDHKLGQPLVISRTFFVGLTVQEVNIWSARSHHVHATDDMMLSNETSHNARKHGITFAFSNSQ